MSIFDKAFLFYYPSLRKHKLWGFEKIAEEISSYLIMTNMYDYTVDAETADKIGLQLTTNQINTPITPNARVFEYQGLENVFVMESDLYGNKMLKVSCFLAFYGRNGLIGKDLKVKTLKVASISAIKKLVESHSEG